MNIFRKKDDEETCLSREDSSKCEIDKMSLNRELANKNENDSYKRGRAFSCHIIRTKTHNADPTGDIQHYRERAFSFHAARHTTHEAKNKLSHERRRKSMPANEIRYKHDLYASGHIIRELKGPINTQEDDKPLEEECARRTKSFSGHTENGSSGFRRIRSFKTTSKGLINRGDSTYKITNETETASMNLEGGSFTPEVQPTFNLLSSKGEETKNFRVLLIGAVDVGKSSIINQFMTSEFLGCEEFNVSQSDSDRTVTLQVDGEESTLEFLQSEDFQEEDEGFQIDAFVVVYCITERETFDIAIDLMKQIREEVGKHKAIILVGNKSDLVRKRTISQEEGRSAADSYGSKYIELSAALNHKVDELLVGIHKQIMLKHDAETPTEDVDQKVLKQKERKSSFKRTKRFLEKVFLGHSGKDKKTENLYVD